MNNEEVWADIPDYEGIYQVSNFGAIRRWRKKYKKFDLLKSNLDKKGYYKIMLSKESVVKKYWIHSLVAICFLKHEPKGMNSLIDHKDNNKLNNYFENLEITTNRLNVSKGFKNKGTKSGITGVEKFTLKNGDIKYLPFISINKTIIRFNREKDKEKASKIYKLSVINLHLFIGDKQEFKNLIYNLYEKK